MSKNEQRTPLLPGWLVWLVAMAFIIASFSVSYFGWQVAQAVWEQPLNAAVGNPQPISTGGAGNFATPAPIVIITNPGDPVIQPTPLPTLPISVGKWRSGDRVNILLMGIDRRPGEPFISRTDTMMLLSLNPTTNKISILSIPRDLYVEIPGYGRHRINNAFIFGARGVDPDAGARLSMETIRYNLGIPINHYVLVDFSAVVKAVDTVGGLDINVPKTINDPTFPDMYFGYDPLFIPAGWNHFDGELALKYARTRHVDNDFGRASRQQALVLAMRHKVLSLGLGELIQQAPLLYQQMQAGVRTDLSLEQLLRLAQSASEVETTAIRNEVLDFNYVVNHKTSDGQQVLVLINYKAGPLIESLFYD